MGSFLRTVSGALAVLCGLSLIVSLFPGMAMAAYAAVAFGSYGALRTAWESVRERQVDVNLLMVLAAVGAIVVGQPADAGVLLFLFSLSGALEELAMARTRSAIEGLVQLRPDTALRVREGREETVPVEALEIGDMVRVPPFQPVPIDGTVLSGASDLDTSAMTGESREVPISVGMEVLGGTQNLSGAFVLSVTRTVGNSTLDRIVSLVEEAQDNKASGERISAWFGQRYTFFVLFAAIGSWVIRLLIGTPHSVALYQSLTLLVALSPCALVISTPAATLSALAFAARKGILVRGGEFIERAATIDTIIFDKTGTLTAGKPALVEICVCEPVRVGGGTSCSTAGECWAGEASMSPLAQSILSYAAAAEVHSSHPFADAIRKAAKSFGLPSLDLTEERVVPGLGVYGRVDGREVWVGQKRFLESEGVPIPEDFALHIEQLQTKGVSVALVALDDRLAALGFADEVRDEAAPMLARLRALGVNDFKVLTGDTQQNAASIVGKFGLPFAAGLLPQEKTSAIKALVDSGKRTMMVGDGINDAPALAQSTLGVAMGGLGSDIAMNAADVVLMHDRLDRIPTLIELGRRTSRVIRGNLLFAGGVIAALTITSLFFTLPLPIAVVGHEGSTVLVILNGLRLLRGK